MLHGSWFWHLAVDGTPVADNHSTATIPASISWEIGYVYMHRFSYNSNNLPGRKKHSARIHWI